MCNGTHGIWSCEPFKQLPVNQRWDKAKALSLCYRCLGDNHFGRKCRFSRVCGIDNCNKIHHTLLHRAESQSDNQHSESVHTENHTHTFHDSSRKFIGLRTVPVIVCHGTKQLKSYALLDDGSTQTFLNRDVALE